MKRAVDLLLSSIGLVITSPILLLVAAAVRLADRGPALFRQERMGRHLVPFHMLKFRTMVVGAEQHGPGVTARGDARVTPVGRWLRDSKLDELPQLINVLRGEMSLVGPRPELPRYVRLFEPEFRDVLRVRPGLTDLASIAYRKEGDLLAGEEDPERKYVREILPDKLRLARAYSERASLWTDLALLARTLFAMVYPVEAADRLLDRLGRFHGRLATLVQLVLIVAANGAALPLPGAVQAIVGRNDAVSNFYPDIDLTPYGALDQGVGRRHLRLFVQSGQVMVEDLDSTNGTMFNGQKLAARQPQPLRDGDQLQVGRLLLRFQA